MLIRRFSTMLKLFRSAGIQNPEIREDLSSRCGVWSLRTELLSVGCLLPKSGLKPFRLRFSIKSRSEASPTTFERNWTQRSGTKNPSKRSHLSVASFLNSINPHLLKEDFRELLLFQEKLPTLRVTCHPVVEYCHSEKSFCQLGACFPNLDRGYLGYVSVLKAEARPVRRHLSANKRNQE